MIYGYEDCFESEAYQKYEEKEKTLQEGEFYELYAGLYACNTEEEIGEYWQNNKEEFARYDKKVGSFTKKVIEPSYKEVYKMFRKVTGHQLRYYGVDYDFFKEAVDEWIGYGETVYSFYTPDMIANIEYTAHCWEEQKNHP